MLAEVSGFPRATVFIGVFFDRGVVVEEKGRSGEVSCFEGAGFFCGVFFDRAMVDEEGVCSDVDRWWAWEDDGDQLAMGVRQRAAREENKGGIVVPEQGKMCYIYTTCQRKVLVCG